MSQERLPRVLQLVDRLSGPSCWRTLQPCAELQRLGLQAFWEFIGEQTDEQRAQLGLRPIPDDVVQRVLAYACSGRVDAVVLPRMGWHKGDEAQVRDLIAKLRKAGNTLIYEADDDIFSPWIVQQQATGLHRDTDRAVLDAERLSRIEVLRLCDGATVSTQRLATVVRQFVPETFPIHVVPNLIDWAWWQRIKAVAQRWIPPLTIGWAGGGRPDADLADMAWAWGEIARQRDDVRFVVAGCRTDEVGQPSLDATPWAKQITNYVLPERIEALPWFSITEYPLAYLNIDIGCCPLADVPFNRCKCVTGDTLIVTERGLVPIASLSPMRVVDTLVPLNMRVWTTEGWATAEDFYYGGEQNTIRVTTKAGFQVEGTVDHPIRRASGEWAMLASLAVGDAVKIEPVMFSAEYVDVPFNLWAVRARREVSQDASSLPWVRITEEWGTFLGYLLGDGNIQKNMIRVTCDKQDVDVITHLMATLSSLGLEPKLKHHHSRYGGQDVCASSARLNDFLWHIGVEREKRRFLAVPPVILCSPKTVVREFLRTLFESDGTVDVKNSRMSFTSKSLRLAREVQLLLTGFGVFSHIYNAYNKPYQRFYYRVVLRRSAAEIFSSEIGFVGNRKSSSLSAIVGKPHSNRYRDEKWADTIAGIEQSQGEVFDVTVPGPAEFASNGFMSHNTPVKLWEYVAAGAAVVASPTVYRPFMQGLPSNFVCTTKEEWRDALLELVNDLTLRALCVEEMTEQIVPRHTLQENCLLWTAAWQDIIEQVQLKQRQKILVKAN